MLSHLWGWYSDRCCVEIDTHRSLLLHHLAKHRDLSFCTWFKSKTEQYVVINNGNNMEKKNELTQKLYHFTEQLYRHVVSERKCYTQFNFDKTAIRKTKLIIRVKASNLHAFQFVEIDDNRVFRYYGIDMFIRVDFEDDSDIKTILTGFKLYGTQYLPIGASSSLMSDRGIYFTSGENPMKMMDVFGTFSSKIVTRIARQCLNFTSTTETITILKYLVEDDILSEDGGILSDGIGMISYSAAVEVCKILKIKRGVRFVPVPRAFQCRVFGFKGMLTVVPDHIMKGKQIILRKSMKKFDANPIFNKLEIVEELSENDKADINRQIIILLSSLHIKDNVFLDAQFKALDSCRSSQEEFRAKLNNAKEKTKFDMKDSVIARGILDETRQLRDNQVIVITKKGVMVGGGKKVLVFRNPGLHPKDVRIFETVSIPNYYENWFKRKVDLRGSVIIFAANCKEHNIPGDLDGDIFFTSWNEEIIPKEQYLQSWWSKVNDFVHNIKEFGPEQVISYFEHKIHSLKQLIWTSVDVFEFRMTSNIGIICNKWVAVCEKEGADSPRAKELAMLANDVMEASKDGKLVVLPLWTTCYEKPDYMGGRLVSTSIIGKLYKQAIYFEKNF